MAIVPIRHVSHQTNPESVIQEVGGGGEGHGWAKETRVTLHGIWEVPDVNLS